MEKQAGTKKNLNPVSRFSIPKPWDNIVIFVLNMLILVPDFIILHINLIDPEWPLHLYMILLFLAIIVIMLILLMSLKKYVLCALICYLIILIWGTLFQCYGFNAVYEDYRSMIYGM